MKNPLLADDKEAQLSEEIETVDSNGGLKKREVGHGISLVKKREIGHGLMLLDGGDEGTSIVKRSKYFAA